MEYEQMTADQIKIAKLEQALTEKLEQKEMPAKTENNKRIRLETPSASEDGKESPAEEEPYADSQSEEASTMDEDETDVQDNRTDDFPPLPPPKPVVQLPQPPKPTTHKKLEQKNETLAKKDNNKRIRLEIPSASEDGKEVPAEEEPYADSQSEEASTMDEDETDVQDNRTDDFPPLPPPKPVVQLPQPRKPTTHKKHNRTNKMYYSNAQ
ncbi:unnamed protein product [Hermetia illucens]|uniref:Uncharacterized protein n=1 Tax=Hermetia illucens TaxID=343691 RepID=A0A7R8V2D6_HERIL|nr:unnamed protein product [Hermetia illucens]